MSSQNNGNNKLSYANTGSKKPLLWTTIGDRLKHAAEKYPDNDALVAVWRNERYTYEHFYKICRRAAKGLMRMGVKKATGSAFWLQTIPNGL